MGGGGGNNNGMMMMQMQQQAAAEERARQEAIAQRAYQAEKDQYQRGIDEQTRAQTLAQQQDQQRRQDEATALSRRDQEQMTAMKRQQEIEDRQYQEGLSAAAQQRQDQQYAQQRADAQAEQQRQVQYANESRTREDTVRAQQQQREDAAIAAAQAKEDAKAAALEAQKQATLTGNRTRRDAVYKGSLSDADAQMQALGITDPAILAAVHSALGTSLSGISDEDTNPGASFAGVTDKVLGQQEASARTRYGGEIDKFAAQGFENQRIGDTLDDTILEGILGKQYDSAAADAKRLLDRGVTTQEGYDANLKGLETQKNTGRAKLTTLGNNELSAQRTKLSGIANQGRSAASAYKLGQTFNPTSYSDQINNEYDTWFKGLGGRLEGLAPTDLFDTSGFLNTAGRVSGPTNSPFTGSTNALTGANALADETDPTKKKTAVGAAPSMGVF